jgi:hypothetical protein
MTQTSISKSGPQNRRRRLLDVHIKYWPQPAGQATVSRKWLQWICNDLISGLDVDRWTVNPPYRRPAAAGAAKTAATTEAVSPYCWIDSIDYGTCDVNGEEVPCRIEHWLCDDGTCYDEEVHTTMALKTTKPLAEPGDKKEAAAGG